MLFKRSQILTYASPAAPKSTAARHHHPQTQSLFINRLPAELKNEIYTLVFAISPPSTTEQSLSKRRPHPLSLLLTCRLINNSASLLAFKTYTFPLSTGLQPTYLHLRSAIAHLSTPQVHAIRSLSALSSIDTTALLSNALLLLPSLSHFSITASRTRDTLQNCGHVAPPRLRSSRPSHAFTDYSESTDLALRAIDIYAAPWFVHVLESMVAGKAFKWQKGERWEVRWPQLDSEMCYSRVQCDVGGLNEELWMDGDAVGAVQGVEFCGCGGVSWTRAVLVQEGGRRVGVEVVYRGSRESEVRMGECVPKVNLVPGTLPAEGLVVARAGIGYDADEDYWEAMRRSNGNLGAVCRGLWNSAAVWPKATPLEKGSVNQAPSLAAS